MKTSLLTDRCPFACVAFNPRVDRRHAPHSGGPLTADGENAAEIAQIEHGKDSLECVTVDAHRRGDVRGGLLPRCSCSSSSSRARLRACPPVRDAARLRWVSVCLE